MFKPNLSHAGRHTGQHLTRRPEDNPLKWGDMGASLPLPVKSSLSCCATWGNGENARMERTRELLPREKGTQQPRSLRYTRDLAPRVLVASQVNEHLSAKTTNQSKNGPLPTEPRPRGPLVSELLRQANKETVSCSSSMLRIDT